MSFNDLDKFIEEYQIETTERKDILKADGIRCKDTFKYHRRVCELISTDHFPSIDSVDINKAVFDTVKTHINNKKKSDEVKEAYDRTDQALSNLGIRCSVKDLQFIEPLNYANGKNCKLVDSASGQLLTVIKNKDILSFIQKTIGAEGYDVWWRNNYSMKVVTYDPTKPELFFEDDISSYLNTYEKPQYLSCDSVPEKPARFLKLLETLFPVEQHREVVEELMYYCVTNKRAMQSLLIIGLQGCGKGTLFIETLRPLVGRQNHFVLNNSFNKSSFDSGIRNHTVIVADEMEFENKVVKNKFKNLIGNRFVTLEEKNVSAHDSEEIFANFIFNSNYEKKFFYEIEDRLFLAPDLATKKLDQVLGEQWIKDYLETLTDPKVLFSIYSYLVEKFGHIETPRLLKIESETEKRMIHRNDIYTRRAFLECCYKGPISPTRDFEHCFQVSDVSARVKAMSSYKESYTPRVNVDNLERYIELYFVKYGVTLAEVVDDGNHKMFKSNYFKKEELGKYVK